MHLPTPGDNSSFEDEVRLFSGVEDLDEHTVHVVSLDSVPEEWDENEVIAENIGEAAARFWAGELIGDVQDDHQDGQGRRQV